MAASCGNNRGFTLIELCIVITISGLVMAAVFQGYTSYLNDKRFRDSYEKQQLVKTGLINYANAQNRLPCPGSPNIPVSDIASGFEITAMSCSTLRDTATAFGTCLEGVCKAQGGRDADGDGTNDAVLIGVVPYNAIINGAANAGYKVDAGGTTNVAVLDPWGYQMTYAVSATMTSAATYSKEFGVIDVTTEDPTKSVVSPPATAQYVILSHGEDHMGAVTADSGVTVPCVAGLAQSPNCDKGGRFVSGIRSQGANANYYDDVLLYNAFSVDSLWVLVPSSGGDIYNKNSGNVGIGTDNPNRKLDVVGNIAAHKAMQGLICSKTNTSWCWSPDLFAAPLASGLSLTCPVNVNPAKVNLLKGIRRVPCVIGGVNYQCPQAECEEVDKVVPTAPQMCIGNTYVTGFTAAGAIICEPPPP